MEEIKNGVAKDTRSEEEKAKDHQHNFYYAGLPVTWIEKPTYKRYLQRNQNGSSSCVFQSCAKAIEILEGVQISASEYFWRNNYPEQGAWIQNAGDIFKNKHCALEKDEPSQFQSETTMNKIRPLNTTVAALGYKFCTPKNIEEIAQAIQAYGQCVITVESNSQEYNQPNQTPVYNGQPIEWGHAICAVDFTLRNGVKTLVCEDSSGQWSSPDGVRFITEDFLTHRNTGAMYFIGTTDVTKLQNSLIDLMKQLIVLLKQKLSTLALLKK